MPDSAAYFKDRRRVREVLEEALETGEVITVHLLSESSSRDVRVVGIDKTWVEIVDYSDLMDALSIQVWRRSAILAVRWGTAHEEANNYLLPSVPNLET